MSSLGGAIVLMVILRRDLIRGGNFFNHHWEDRRGEEIHHELLVNGRVEFCEVNTGLGVNFMGMLKTIGSLSVVQSFFMDDAKASVSACQTQKGCNDLFETEAELYPGAKALVIPVVS